MTTTLRLTRHPQPHAAQPSRIMTARTTLETLLMSSDTPGEGATNLQARQSSNEPTGRSAKVNPSSWIDKVLYRNHFVVIFLKPIPNRPRTALLYSNVPSWMCGLVCAGEGGRSIGAAYNSLLKRRDVQEKYGIEYQRIEGEERVRELERMMLS